MAKRRLASGHSANSTYTLTVELETLEPPSADDLKEVAESMAGNVETIYFGTRRIWNATIAPVALSSDSFSLIDEFLSSTADGQEFSFDPYETGTPLTVVRNDKGHQLSKFVSIDGPNDYVRIAFQVREV